MCDFDYFETMGKVSAEIQCLVGAAIAAIGLYCFSAIDGAKLGYNVTVIKDACRAIDLNNSLENSLNDMKGKGVKLLSTPEL